MATLRTPKKSVKQGRQSTKPLYVATIPKASVSEVEKDRVANEFKKSGANLVWLEYSPNSPAAPSLKRMD